MPAVYKVPHLRAKRRIRRRAERQAALAAEVRDTFEVMHDLAEDVATWPLDTTHVIVVDPTGQAPGSALNMNAALAQLPRNGNGRSVRIEIKGKAGGLNIGQHVNGGYNKFLVKGVP